MTLRNTIVAGNFNSTAATRDDISGALVAAGAYNLVGDGTGSSGITDGVNNNQVGSGAAPINALLGPLAANGGATSTHALLAGSPAIDTADNATCPATDQRGVARPGGGVCDKGAYELVDTTPPDTTITANPPNPTNSTTAAFTFSGSDNFTPAASLTFECELDGGGFAACAGPQNYSGLADGSHTFQVRAIDAAGNVDTSPASFTWTIDTTAPVVTINQAAGQADPTIADPTTAGPIHFTAIFSEPVTGFGDGAGDVTLSGSAGATTAAVSEIAPNDGTTYDVAVSGMTVDGTVIAVVPGGAASDAAGNPNAASTSTDNTVVFIANQPPNVTINQAAGQADPMFGSPIRFSVVFSEPVTGFGNGTGDVTLGGTAGATTAVVSEIAPSDGTTYEVAVSGMTADGTVIAVVPGGAANDAFGAPNTASTSTDNTVAFVADVELFLPLVAR